MSSGLEIIGPRKGTAPYAYSISEQGVVSNLTAHALFDGTGAAGTFLPALGLYMPDGTRIGRYVDRGSPVSAGGSAHVSFAPFLKATASASGGSGVKVYGDGSFVATEPGIDFEDGTSVFWSFSDNPGAGYVSVKPNGPYYSVGSATGSKSLTSGVAAEIGFLNLQAGGGLVGTHAVGGASGFSLSDVSFLGGSSGSPAFVTFSATWPAGAYSRYFEVALDNPQGYGTPTPMTYPSPIRYTASTTPEGDLMCATALVVPVPTGSPIRLNAFQSSGGNQTVTVSVVVEASLAREV